MKFGLSFFPISPRLLIPITCKADVLGYDSVWVGEHVVFPSLIESQHPDDDSSLPPPLPTTPLYDPLITFAFIAAQTQRIRFGTSIYLLALRHPIAAARLITTLDRLSNGRFLLGLGVGWLQEEFAALGVPWEHRGARMDESLAVMRRLWTEERIEHGGRFYQFDEIGFEPKPINGTVPILIGGETPLALKRAVRVGDGWFGLYNTPESAAVLINQLRTMRESDTPFEYSVSSATVPTLDEARRFRDAGVDRLNFMARMLSGNERSLEAILDGLERFAAEVIDRLD